MRAEARIVAQSDGRRGTRLAVLRGESPLLLRRTGSPGGAGTTVHLVGGAAGPLRGDDLRLAVEVGPGAHLTVRSVAASLALPGRSGMPASRLAVHAVVAAGATLRWVPEPLIAAAGCDHRTVTTVEVCDGGELLWRDDLVCGRHGESPGDVRSGITVRYAGTTLHRHELAIGPDAPGWSGAAVLGGGGAAGTVVMAGPGAQARALPLHHLRQGRPRAEAPRGPGRLQDDAAVMPLAGPGVLVTAVGPDIRAVRAALDPFCGDAWAATAKGDPAGRPS
jgi:urease accessory protein